MSQYEWTSIWFLFPETEVFSIWKMTLEGTVTRQPPTAIACACEMYFFLQPRLLPNSHITTSFSLFPFRFLIPFLYLSLSLSLSLAFSLYFFSYGFTTISTIGKRVRRVNADVLTFCFYLVFTRVFSVVVVGLFFLHIYTEIKKKHRWTNLKQENRPIPILFYRTNAANDGGLRCNQKIKTFSLDKIIKQTVSISRISYLILSSNFIFFKIGQK